MKIYNLSVLVEPKGEHNDTDIIREISQQIRHTGQEMIFCPVGGDEELEVLKVSPFSPFPSCLTCNTRRISFDISLPTRKDLGRRWFLKRLESPRNNTYLLVATSDVSVIHIELEPDG